MRNNRMLKGCLGITLVSLMGLGAAACFGAPPADTKTPNPSAKTRVGVFESRAVALAYGRSQMNTERITKLRADFEAAKQAGDKKRAAELEKTGADYQDRMHRQVFGDAPIPDILEAIKDALPTLQKQARVETILSQRKPAANEEAVDITPILVGYFKPTPETLKIIEEIKKTPPLSPDKFPLKD